MIRALTERLRLAGDVLLHGPTFEKAEPPLRPIGDPWFYEANADARQSAALSLFDDDVVGYFLVRFLAGDDKLRCELDTSYVVEQDWWPAVCNAITDRMVGELA